MICQHCGRTLTPEQKVCPTCKYSVGSVHPASGRVPLGRIPMSSQSLESTTNSNTQLNASRTTLFVLIGIVTFLVFLAIGAWVLSTAQ